MSEARRLRRAPARELLPEVLAIVRSPDAARELRRLDRDGRLVALVPALAAARGLGQSPYHHADVLGHVLEVVQHACAIAADPEPVFRSGAPAVAAALATPLGDGVTAREGLVLAALLHDVAKPITRGVTPEGRVTFIGHDRVGALMAADLLRRWAAPAPLAERVVTCVRQHLPLGFMVHRQPLSLRQLRGYLELTAPAEFELLVLSVADRLATRGPRTSESAIARHLALAREVLDVLWRQREERR